jgi:dihydrofolate synthase
MSIRERLAVNGEAISPEDLHTLLDRHRGTVDAAAAAEGGRLSHFEVLTALAFTHFAESCAAVTVIEAGLGGVRDATNVLDADSLAAAVLTAVGTDHADALGRRKGWHFCSVFLFFFIFIFLRILKPISPSLFSFS